MTFDPKKSQQNQGTMIAIVVLVMLLLMAPVFALL